ncbi:unnamed protein product [Urochloa humidicola]
MARLLSRRQIPLAVTLSILSSLIGRLPDAFASASLAPPSGASHTPVPTPPRVAHRPPSATLLVTVALSPHDRKAKSLAEREWGVTKTTARSLLPAATIASRPPTAPGDEEASALGSSCCDENPSVCFAQVK